MSDQPTRPFKMAQEDWDGELEYLRGEFARVCGYNDRRQKFIALIGRTLGVDSLTLCGEVDRVEAAIQERFSGPWVTSCRRLRRWPSWTTRTDRRRRGASWTRRWRGWG